MLQIQFFKRNGIWSVPYLFLETRVLLSAKNLNAMAWFFQLTFMWSGYQMDERIGFFPKNSQKSKPWRYRHGYSLAVFPNRLLSCKRGGQICLYNLLFLQQSTLVSYICCMWNSSMVHNRICYFGFFFAALVSDHCGQLGLIGRFVDITRQGWPRISRPSVVSR